MAEQQEAGQESDLSRRRQFAMKLSDFQMPPPCQYQTKEHMPASRDEQDKQAKAEYQQNITPASFLEPKSVIKSKRATVRSQTPHGLASPTEIEDQRWSYEQQDKMSQPSSASPVAQDNTSQSSSASLVPQDNDNQGSAVLMNSLTGEALQDYQKQLFLLEQRSKNYHGQVEQELSKYVEEESATKFRCRINQDCTELFEGRNDWRDHVINEHFEWYRGISGIIAHIKTSRPVSEVVQTSSEKTPC